MAVMAGFVPAIHVAPPTLPTKDEAQNVVQGLGPSLLRYGVEARD